MVTGPLGAAILNGRYLPPIIPLPPVIPPVGCILLPE